MAQVFLMLKANGPRGCWGPEREVIDTRDGQKLYEILDSAKDPEPERREYEY